MERLRVLHPQGNQASGKKCSSLYKVTEVQQKKQNHIGHLIHNLVAVGQENENPRK